ncbi:ORF65 [Ranid herpesvirus 2]|uniref:ORF65 n=1 Tax=Ranid herpesvirus 2 TaxID=389214 RepID=Q14W41_9VIRU|nr:ORF65 [Ranid herpesvirus 2]ABG25579.1 ORF65 [Ranid herpesvirus 2]
MSGSPSPLDGSPPDSAAVLADLANQTPPAFAVPNANAQRPSPPPGPPPPPRAPLQNAPPPNAPPPNVPQPSTPAHVAPPSGGTGASSPQGAVSRGNSTGTRGDQNAEVTWQHLTDRTVKLYEAVEAKHSNKMRTVKTAQEELENDIELGGSVKDVSICVGAYVTAIAGDYNDECAKTMELYEDVSKHDWNGEVVDESENGVEYIVKEYSEDATENMCYAQASYEEYDSEPSFVVLDEDSYESVLDQSLSQHLRDKPIDKQEAYSFETIKLEFADFSKVMDLIAEVKTRTRAHSRKGLAQQVDLLIPERYKTVSIVSVLLGKGDATRWSVVAKQYVESVRFKLVYLMRYMTQERLMPLMVLFCPCSVSSDYQPTYDEVMKELEQCMEEKKTKLLSDVSKLADAAEKYKERNSEWPAKIDLADGVKTLLQEVKAEEDRLQEQYAEQQEKERSLWQKVTRPEERRPPSPADPKEKKAWDECFRAALSYANKSVFDEYKSLNRQLAESRHDGNLDPKFNLNLAQALETSGNWSSERKYTADEVCKFLLTFEKENRVPEEAALRYEAGRLKERLRWAREMTTEEEDAERNTRLVEEKIEKETAFQNLKKLLDFFHDNVECSLDKMTITCMHAYQHIPYKQAVKLAYMTQYAYKENIELFRKECQSVAQFYLADQDIFEELKELFLRLENDLTYRYRVTRALRADEMFRKVSHFLSHQVVHASPVYVGDIMELFVERSRRGKLVTYGKHNNKVVEKECEGPLRLLDVLSQMRLEPLEALWRDVRHSNFYKTPELRRFEIEMGVYNEGCGWNSADIPLTQELLLPENGEETDQYILQRFVDAIKVDESKAVGHTVVKQKEKNVLVAICLDNAKMSSLVPGRCYIPLSLVIPNAGLITLTVEVRHNVFAPGDSVQFFKTTDEESPISLCVTELNVEVTPLPARAVAYEGETYVPILVVWTYAPIYCAEYPKLLRQFLKYYLSEPNLTNDSQKVKDKDAENALTVFENMFMRAVAHANSFEHGVVRSATNNSFIRNCIMTGATVETAEDNLCQFAACALELYRDHEAHVRIIEQICDCMEEVLDEVETSKEEWYQREVKIRRDLLRAFRRRTLFCFSEAKEILRESCAYLSQFPIHILYEEGVGLVNSVVHHLTVVKTQNEAHFRKRTLEETQQLEFKLERYIERIKTVPYLQNALENKICALRTVLMCLKGVLQVFHQTYSVAEPLYKNQANTSTDCGELLRTPFKSIAWCS